MCYDDHARPPIPDGMPSSAHCMDVVLKAADGNSFAAYLARPSTTSKAQVVIYPDVRGLHQFYKELALRFAETGITAIAFDYFGRTAGLTARDEPFEYHPHVQQLRLETVFLDVQAALDHLRTIDGNKAVFPVGFCMGGTLTFFSGMNSQFDFSGIIAFYAGMSRTFGGSSTILDQADKVIYPVLGLFGGADPSIPVSSVRALEERLNKAGIENTLVVYDSAPHSFFDRRATEFAAASADAWQRIQSFIAAHS
ncbi:MAG: dienelactone hydrolase family protein [Ktedonobacteraceae bacterium]|nr:dienelactone hydrolase family protein [Ktedonobacteraceae bacterium]